MEELDDRMRLAQLDKGDLIERAGNRAGWFSSARTGVDQALRRMREHRFLDRTPTQIGLALGPELQGIGKLCSLLAGQAGVQVRCLGPAAGPGDGVGLELALYAGAYAAYMPGDTGGDLAQFDISEFCAARDHPAQTLLFLLGLVAQIAGHAHPKARQAVEAQIDAAACHPAASKWHIETPAVRNPGKQLAARLVDRVPIFWGTGLGAGLAEDVALRQLWYAERIAFAVDVESLTRTLIMARLPGYWPNTAVFVEVGAPPEEATVASAARGARAIELLKRRRYFCTQFAPPPDRDAGAVGVTAATLALECGEWLGLYSAFLYHLDPVDRVPLDLLED